MFMVLMAVAHTVVLLHVSLALKDGGYRPLWKDALIGFAPSCLVFSGVKEEGESLINDRDVVLWSRTDRCTDLQKVDSSRCAPANFNTKQHERSPYRPRLLSPHLAHCRKETTQNLTFLRALYFSDGTKSPHGGVEVFTAHKLRTILPYARSSYYTAQPPGPGPDDQHVRERYRCRERRGKKNK
ncbi:uncharacterized protein RSE6_03245 [Rhynchosporium secalis]|uniref:Secreted protein n=1 Tax=Rhynchosporium secalis TaxID=38038 RepID=A0A1E1M2A5_RHYSE|nr:uncharacterized protein RSE6_03245 [Rhynchosporium secalis]